MKDLLIKLGIWEEVEYFTEITESEKALLLEAQRHYCQKCNKWFKEFRGTALHQRVVHEGVLRKNA
mgnify:CR=1 FL=1